MLLVEAALFDVVSFVPPDPPRGEIFVTRIGEATLLLEVSDSQSEAVLARVVDRRAAEPSRRGVRSSRATNRAEIRRLLRVWGEQLRAGLDALHDQTASSQ